jgi:Tfp pilus assembly protein PilW
MKIKMRTYAYGRTLGHARMGADTGVDNNVDRHVGNGVGMIHRGEHGASLVELLVAMAIFMAFFSLSAIQLMRANYSATIRSQATSQVSTAMQMVGRDARSAAGFRITTDSDGDQTVVMAIPSESADSASATSADTVGRCVALTVVKDPDGSIGDGSNGTMRMIRRSKDASKDSDYDEGKIILTSMVSSSDDSSGSVDAGSGVFYGGTVGTVSGFFDDLKINVSVGSRSGGSNRSSVVSMSKTFTARNASLLSSIDTEYCTAP